ncbi:MAG: M15 family metallopeptidase, partial [Acidimicrobiia bacterium]
MGVALVSILLVALARPVMADTDARLRIEAVRDRRVALGAEIAAIEATAADVAANLTAVEAEVARAGTELAAAQESSAAAKLALGAAQGRVEEAAAAAAVATARLGAIDTAAGPTIGDQVSAALQAHSTAMVTDYRLIAAAAADADLEVATAADLFEEARASRDALAAVSVDLAGRLEGLRAEIIMLDTPGSRADDAALGPVGVGSVDLEAVGCAGGGSITVAATIAAAVGDLLAAAEADGFELCGGGYRSADSQIALRRAHCGPSGEAIFELSPSRCSPPTARPGTSMHERGLAIDVTCSGQTLRSRSSACFQWLAANAARYGLRNLPSEPWHWS